MSTTSRRCFLKLSALGATSLAVIPLVAEVKDNSKIRWGKNYNVMVVSRGCSHD